MTVSSAVPTESLRDVRRGVAQAGDAQVLRVVQMVDALENRGATDAVLEPVRSRLRAIQPARPLRFARLLFKPLDPVIVAPKDWRAGTPFLPRSAVMVLARAVRQAMAAAGPLETAQLERADNLIVGATTTDTSIVRAAGMLVWPPAAAALRRLAHDIGVAGPGEACAKAWTAEGLQRAELAPTALSLATILDHAATLHDHDHSGATLEGPALLEMLAASERDGPRAWGMMATLLVIRVPQAAPALLAAADGKAGLRSMAEAATETALAWVESETTDQTSSIGESAPQEVGRQAALLDALSAQPADNARRRRLAEARTHLLDGCLHRLETSLHDQVTTPLLGLPTEPAARAAALDALEVTARTLRRFEVEARRIGGAAKFDALVEGVERSVSAAVDLAPMDRARLVEIMAGPRAAAAQLHQKKAVLF